MPRWRESELSYRFASLQKKCLLCARFFRFYFVLFYLRNAQKARDKSSSNVMLLDKLSSYISRIQFASSLS